MSPPSHAAGRGGACTTCLRRSWLLAELSGPLDYCARDRERLQALLALGDAELLQAVGGRRREELRARYDSFAPHALRVGVDVEALCCHRPAFPEALAGAAFPRMLNILGGGARRLSRLCSAPVVAIVGSRRPSDYGREMARSLARGMAASGVSVLGGWQDGIAAAAHLGVLEADGASVAVTGHGLEQSSAAGRRALLARLTRAGCAVSELPWDCGGRRWGTLAGERTIAALATVTIVVEAERTVGDLAVARLAQALGRPVAAIPGRVTSPLADGSNTLLKHGATLVRDAGDVLELLYATDPSRTASTRTPAPVAHSRLERRLQDLLGRVGAGSDTPATLTRDGAELGETLAGLSELELMGLLRRGDGGRYVPAGALERQESPG
jgi:DNA processing protein